MDFIRYKDDGIDICHSVEFDDDFEILNLIKARIEKRAKAKKELENWQPPIKRRGRPRKFTHLSNH